MPLLREASGVSCTGLFGGGGLRGSFGPNSRISGLLEKSDFNGFSPGRDLVELLGKINMCWPPLKKCTPPEQKLTFIEKSRPGENPLKSDFPITQDIVDFVNINYSSDSIKYKYTIDYFNKMNFKICNGIFNINNTRKICILKQNHLG